MNTAAILLTLAALGGLLMLALRLASEKLPPIWLAMGHGIIALSGLSVLAYHCATERHPPLAHWALLLLGLAAAGGATLFAGFHLRGRSLPLLLVVGHGTLAAIGLTVLLLTHLGALLVGPR